MPIHSLGQGGDVPARKIASRFLSGSVPFGQAVRDLAAQVGSGAKLARSLGVSPSTVYRWMDRDEPPRTLATGTDLRTTFLRRERYYYNERPERLKNKPALPQGTSFANLERDKRSAIVGRLESVSDAGIFAFDLTGEHIRGFDRLIDEGRDLIFTINAQQDVLEPASYVTITIPTAGRTQRAILSHYYRALRNIIDRQVRKDGSSDISLILVSIQVEGEGE